MAPPLKGLRVLDLSRILAGPTATQLLADLGAEVIKVERPGRGDDTRSWGPPFLQNAEGQDTAESAYYLCANRGKKSVAVDISTKAGQDLIRELAAVSDVVIENFKVGDLKRRGLGYEDLKALNPRLIYCSISGFGQTGPYADRAGYDFLIQGMGGIMSLTGEAGREPMKTGVGIADVMCGMYATTAILAALQARGDEGEGQYIDISLLDTQVSWLINQGVAYLTDGKVPPRRGNEHPTIVPYGTFPAADGDFILAVGNDTQFAKFCEIAGSGLAADKRFAKNRDRVLNREVLIPLLRQITVTRTLAEWIAALEKVAVPCGSINDLAEVFDNPQIKARGMKITLPHPVSGEVDLIGNPIRMSGTPVEYCSAPPTLGADTVDVLQSLLGKSEEEIASLRKAGAMGGET